MFVYDVDLMKLMKEHVKCWNALLTLTIWKTVKEIIMITKTGMATRMMTGFNNDKEEIHLCTSTGVK